MKAHVHHGPGKRTWAEVPKPRFTLDEFEAAYDVFGEPSETGALKVLLTAPRG